MKSPSSPDSSEGLIAGLTQGPAKRIERGNYIIHLEPRISAAKLAEYVIANPIRQDAIAQNAKIAPKVIVFPYSRVRNAFPNTLSGKGLNPDSLLAYAQEAETAEFQTDWQRDDNKRSADALKRLAKIAPGIDCSHTRIIHRPQSGWGELKIGGVRVSVNPELVFALDHRGVEKVGAIILNTGQSDNLSLDRTNGKNSVGDYLTVLLYRMLEHRLKHVGAPLHTRCYAIDIFRNKVHTAPAAHKMLLRHLDSACKMIALRWATIEIPANLEIKEAEADF